MPVLATAPTVTAPANLGRVRSLRASLALGVWGDPGVGKTHWVEALLREGAITQLRVGARVTVSSLAQRIPVGKPRPVWLERRLNDVLHGRFGESKDLAEFITALLALSAPIALHVEDLHTADAESTAFWSALAGFVGRSKGVALIATGRSAPPAPFQAWRLEPLSEAASDALLEGTIGATLPPEARGWLWSRAQGNVLFTLEYLRFATRQGWLWSDGQRWRWRAPSDPRPPTSLEGLLSRLLEEAAETSQARTVLEARAVLPEAADGDVWRAASGLDDEAFEVATASLERHGVIVAGSFAHRLYREVMLARLEPQRMKQLAAPALELLLKRDNPASRGVAVRLLEFADADAPVALSVLLSASQDALGAGDALRAALLEARAVAYAPGETRAGLAINAARALRAVRPAEALRLAEIARGSDASLEASFLTAELRVLNGEGDAADALVRAMGDAPFQLEWLPRLIALRVQRLDFEAALALWNAHPELHGTAAPLLRRDVAWAMIQFGEGDAAEVLLKMALGGSSSEPERGALLMALAYRNLIGGELRDAERFAAEAVSLLESEAASLDLARALEIRAEVLENQGLSLEAAQLSTRAVAVRGELGDAWGVCRAQLRLSSALLELGEYERSEELLLESRAILERRDAREALIVWDCQLAHLYAEWNPPHGASLALRHARDALRRARERAHPTMLNTALAGAAWVEAWYGDPQTALSLSDEALTIAAELGQADQSGLETMARAAALEGLGRLDEARLAYRDGVAQLRGAGLASAERYALELDRLEGDAENAAQRVAIFEARGSRHGANLARRYFSQLQTAPLAQPNNALELQVLGALRVVQNGVALRVQTRAGKALLAILLEARLEGRGEVTDLELMDRLFTQQSDRRARDGLKNLVYRLRTTIGAGAITRTPTGYALGRVLSDAERFLETGDLKLWRGAYLEDSSELGSRGETRNTLLTALRTATETQLETNFASAVRAARVCVSMEPYDENALRLLLRALRASNNRRDLARAYEAARGKFLEVDAELPELWQTFLGIGVAP